VATNERFMPVTPPAIWEALADPDTYGFWVVGSKRIRDADPAWPAPGTRFHHTIGVGPFTVNDHTRSLEAQAPRLLRMRAKGRRSARPASRSSSRRRTAARSCG